MRAGLRDDARAVIDQVLVDGPPAPGTVGTAVPRVVWAQLVARRTELGGRSDLAGGTGSTRMCTAIGILSRELERLQGPDHLVDQGVAGA